MLLILKFTNLSLKFRYRYHKIIVSIIDPGHEESSSPLDGELHADNNANSTYSEPSTREESPVSSLLHFMCVVVLSNQRNML